VRVLLDEHGFESFLTADHNLEYQQNLQAVRLGIVVLVAASNALEDLLPLVPETLEILSAIQPGQVVRVPGNSGNRRGCLTITAADEMSIIAARG
jgi:hypothetical protein